MDRIVRALIVARKINDRKFEAKPYAERLRIFGIENKHQRSLYFATGNAILRALERYGYGPTLRWNDTVKAYLPTGLKSTHNN